MTTDTDAGPAFRGAAKRLIEAHNENAMLHLRLHLVEAAELEARR